MAKGISIHIGVNWVDKKHYGTQLKLRNCENDARMMMHIADQNGFFSHLLVNETATSYNFFYFLNRAADELHKEDILFISFSGHGAYVPNTGFYGDDGESSGYDQAILLYNRMVIDDELNLMWQKFRAGVRILFVSDSCYSGTITKNMDRCYNVSLAQGRLVKEVRQKNKEVYDSILQSSSARIPEPQCSVLLLAACQDDEVAQESEDNLSLFTSALVTCWDDGSFKGGYIQLYQAVKKEMRARYGGQTPNYCFIGKENKDFEGQRPFTI